MAKKTIFHSAKNFFWGLPTRFARVGLCRGSQVCSALRRLRLLGLRLRRPTFHPSACGPFGACRTLRKARLNY